MSGWSIQCEAIQTNSIQTEIVQISQQIIEVKNETIVLNNTSVAQPVSLQLDLSEQAISLSPVGGKISINDLAQIVFEQIILSVDNVNTMRSFLGRLYSSLNAVTADVSGVKVEVADLSGTRIPALEAVDATLSAQDLIHDLSLAVHDASLVLQVAVDAIQTLDISGVVASVAAVDGRVAALEAAPAFDASGILVAISDLQAAKASVSYVDTAVADKATVSYVDSAVAPKADSATVDSALAAKADQSAVDSALAAKADASVVSDLSGVVDTKAAASVVADLSGVVDMKEDKGKMHKLIVEDFPLDNVSPAYWAETISAAVQACVDAFKLANVIYSQDLTLTFAPASPVAGAVYRVRHGGSAGILSVVVGDLTAELVAGETGNLHFDGSAWRLL
jgi:hypothetical protein